MQESHLSKNYEPDITKSYTVLNVVLCQRREDYVIANMLKKVLNPQTGVHLYVRQVSEMLSSLSPLLFLLHFTKLVDFIMRFEP